MTTFIDPVAGIAPESCTLPTADRPLRLAEFRALLTNQVRSVDRVTPTRLDVGIPADVVGTARSLASRESECCSFFTFGFERSADAYLMRIDVPSNRTDVLDGLQELAGVEDRT